MEQNTIADYQEYLESIVYFPIEYDENDPVYYFEYTQRTFNHKKLHYHNGFEIGVCLEGEGIFLVKNKVYPFRKGCVTFISSLQPHIAQSPNDYPSRWKYLTIDWEKLFGQKEIQVNQNVIWNEEMAQLVEIIYAEAERHDGSSIAVITHLLNALVLKFLRYEGDAELDEAPAAKVIDPKIYASIKYIINHYGERLSVKDLAVQSNYSINYFRKLFTEQTGVTPLNYITNIRLRMAAILLRSSDRTIIDIAEACGFNSLSSFNRCFHNQYGTTPAQWRKTW
ncbi:MAG: helix-turn-helix transcriptional regulator [Oscillospiraceae bacterium]|nr:helix-turn-helix transcriptional regulator [Oscillospiraceae bacterium]